jgi:hypothetical protein
MKSNSLDALIGLKRFEVEGKRRKVAGIEAMISDFNYIAAELDRQIATEEARAGVFDVGYYAYPTFAKLAIQRRANLAASVSALETQLAGARRELHEACEELKRIELLGERDTVGPVPNSGEVAA